MLKLGVIGYGSRCNNVVKKLVGTNKVMVAAIADIDIETVKSKYINPNGFENINYYTDATEMLENEKLDGVFVGTRCSLHTKFAELVDEYNLPLFLEKPVCTNYEDLHKLENLKNIKDKIVVSFPLRRTVICMYVKDIIDSGKIGDIAHIQAYNNVNYGRGYYHKWYRDESETGGLFLQKSTHDLDYINFLVGDLKPVYISAMQSKQVFKGDKKKGLRCSECPDAKTCTESEENLKKQNPDYFGDYCCFAVDTGNHDSGSVLVEYSNGMHAVYSQNFIVRNDAGKRGARIVGYKGTIEFDWVKNTVIVHHHLDNITETHTFESTSGHHGGDEHLCENFIGVMEGSQKSETTLQDGILSAKMCLAAKKSAEEHKFICID